MLAALIRESPLDLMTAAISATSARETSSQLPKVSTSETKARSELMSEVFCERMV